MHMVASADESAASITLNLLNPVAPLLHCSRVSCISVVAVGAAKGGATSVKPILQNLYRTRASAYQQAVRSFVDGYREGFAEPPRSMAAWGTQPAGQKH